MNCETLSVLFDKQIRQAVFFFAYVNYVVTFEALPNAQDKMYTHKEECQKCSDNTKPKRLVYSLIKKNTDLWN